MIWSAVDNLACTLPFGAVLLGGRGYVSETLRYYFSACTARALRCNIQIEKMGVARIRERLIADVSLKIAAVSSASSALKLLPV